MRKAFGRQATIPSLRREERNRGISPEPKLEDTSQFQVRRHTFPLIPFVSNCSFISHVPISTHGDGSFPAKPDRLDTCTSVSRKRKSNRMASLGPSSDTQPIHVPLEGKIWLILYRKNPSKPLHSSFHLDIPIVTIQGLCLRPIKYLKYLSWCILGLKWDIVRSESIQSNDDILMDGAIYFFRSPDGTSQSF